MTRRRRAALRRARRAAALPPVPGGVFPIAPPALEASAPLARRLDIATARGWHRAAARLRSEGAR